MMLIHTYPIDQLQLLFSLLDTPLHYWMGKGGLMIEDGCLYRRQWAQPHQIPADSEPTMSSTAVVELLFELAIVLHYFPSCYSGVCELIFSFW